ncbi:hypothetical protein U9M48_042010 [Paspalum notatum var. saurae]|uniref:Uncharacterized protein n=1 Tax=Paspalum notatum var. saurae TaxID=547442 RepID=A0AAQ3XET5_PASNO
MCPRCHFACAQSSTTSGSTGTIEGHPPSLPRPPPGAHLRNPCYEPTTTPSRCTPVTSHKHHALAVTSPRQCAILNAEPELCRSLNRGRSGPWGMCCDKLKDAGACHVCGCGVAIAGTGGYLRCHAVERVVDSVRAPCPHAPYGYDASYACVPRPRGPHPGVPACAVPLPRRVLRLRRLHGGAPEPRRLRARLAVHHQG